MVLALEGVKVMDISIVFKRVIVPVVLRIAG